MKKWPFASLIALILFASVLRFYNLKQFPPALFSDEVDLGYQAYSFLKTGRDYYGNKLPISFRSFADFRAPLYLYSATATISLFGLNEWGVRLPAAIFGVLGVVSIFLLSLKLGKNFNFALLCGLVLAILPWHFHYSRAGFEVSALFFLLSLGLFFFFEFLEKRKTWVIFLSLAVLSLCFYTYATSRLFLPLLGFVALLVYHQEIFKLGLKKVSISFLICFLLLLPFAKNALLGEGLHRFSYLNIFSDSNLKFEIDRQRLVDAVHDKTQEVGMKTPFIAYVFHNKPLSWTIEIIENYASSFSLEFLFLQGGPNLRHGIGRMGGVLVVFLPFLIIGLFRVFEIIKTGKTFIFSPREAVFFLSFLLLAPIPSSITYDGGTHATRLFFMVLPLTLFISLGLWEFGSWFKKKKTRVVLLSLVAFLSILNFSYYLHLYYYHYPVESQRLWHYGFKEALKRLVAESRGYDKIVLSSTYEPPLVFFLFWSKYPPQDFNAGSLVNIDNSWFEGKQLNQYFFGRLRSSFWDSYLSQQAQKQKMEKILILAGRNDFGGDLDMDEPPGLKVIEKFYLPSQEPVLFLLRTKTFEELQAERVK
ncbi:MAG TPA: glycosyltransferase family 39 protein [Clostridia bacterium]|nr:glycosyltransferase family 39 protein [Clostridia bacterium]